MEFLLHIKVHVNEKWFIFALVTCDSEVCPTLLKGTKLKPDFNKPCVVMCILLLCFMRWRKKHKVIKMLFTDKVCLFVNIQPNTLQGVCGRRSNCIIYTRVCELIYKNGMPTTTITISVVVLLWITCTIHNLWCLHPSMLLCKGGNKNPLRTAISVKGQDRLGQISETVSKESL